MPFEGGSILADLFRVARIAATLDIGIAIASLLIVVAVFHIVALCGIAQLTGDARRRIFRTARRGTDAALPMRCMLPLLFVRELMLARQGVPAVVGIGGTELRNIRVAHAVLRIDGRTPHCPSVIPPPSSRRGHAWA